MGQKLRRDAEPGEMCLLLFYRIEFIRGHGLLLEVIRQVPYMVGVAEEEKKRGQE